jgi:site-specific DNA-cytosine methylase
VLNVSQVESSLQPKALNLFSGQGSWRDTFLQKGFEVVSLDWDPKNHENIQENILHWKYWEDFKPGDFEVISASIPCENYSLAHTRGSRDMKYANRLARKTLEIIQYFKPSMWFVENPRFGLLRNQHFMKNISYIDVDYCRFEDYGYKKPTRIWGPLKFDLWGIFCAIPRIVLTW